MHPSLISSSKLRHSLLGGISDMSLWRWLNDPELRFPKPLYIGRRRYWLEAEVSAWIEARAANA